MAHALPPPPPLGPPPPPCPLKDGVKQNNNLFRQNF